jgi:hypothetical protein
MTYAAIACLTQQRPRINTAPTVPELAVSDASRYGMGKAICFPI